MQKFNYVRHDKRETLISFLVRRFPYQNEERWLESIETGAIRLNGERVSPFRALKTRDIISYCRPRSLEPEIDETYTILYKDESMLLVEKSGNIPISESGRYYQNTLLNLLREKEGFSELYAVHRLDKETSGILVIARSKHVATRFGEQFARHEPEKLYTAVLIGEMPESEVLVDRPLRRANQDESKVRIRQVVHDQGKPSRTLFSVERRARGLTLARIQTFSGRTHQIRCHAEFIGFPILGDKLYGQSDDRFLSFLKGESEPIFPPFGRVDHQLLHASSLSFLHPETGEKVTFTSDYRKEFLRYPGGRELLKR